MKDRVKVAVFATVAALLISAFAAAPAVASSTVTPGWESRLAEIRTGVNAKVDITKAEMFDRTKTVTSRALMSVVAHELRDNSDAAAAWDVAKVIFDHQSMDPTDE